MDVSSIIDLTRNETKNVQNKHKYKKKNIARIHSDSTAKLQGSFTCSELEKTPISSPSTSRKPKFSTTLNSNGKSGSNVIANNNVTVNTDTRKVAGVDFIKRNVMRVSIFTKTSSKEDTNNIKINSKPKVFTKRAKTKSSHTKDQAKTEKSLCNIDSKINETINYSLSSNTNETQVNIFSPISDHKKILNENERLSFVCDDSKKNCACIEKFKTRSLNPKGVSKSDLNSLKDFISSMSAASVQSASVHSDLKAELPSDKNTTTNKKLVVKFASEVKTSIEQTVSKDSIKNDACDLNSPSVRQTTTGQTCEIFMPSVKDDSETSIEVDLVQETISRSPECELLNDAVMTSDIQLNRASMQEPVNNDTTIQLHVNNEIVRFVRLDERDSGSSEMVCLHILISYLTVYCFVTYTFYFLYFILFILFLYTVLTLRK